MIYPVDSVIHLSKNQGLVFMRVLYPGELEFGMLVFVEGGKPENLEKKPLRVGREPTTNSTHRLESNAGHIVERRALSPLRHPCFPNTNVWSHLVCNFQAYSHASSRNVTNIIRQPDPPLLLNPIPNLTLLVTTPYNGTTRGRLVLTFVN